MILQLMDGKGGFIGVPHIYEAEGELCGASNSGGSMDDAEDGVRIHHAQ